MSVTTRTISKKLKRKAAENDSIDVKSSKTKTTASSRATMVDSSSVTTFALNLRLSEISKLEDSYPLAAKLLAMETKYCDELVRISYGSKVTHVYNPVDYAYKPHIEFYRKFCKDTAEVLFIGENPGPFGGAQTGVSLSVTGIPLFALLFLSATKDLRLIFFDPVLMLAISSITYVLAKQTHILSSDDTNTCTEEIIYLF